MCIRDRANITPNELIQVVRLKKAAILLAENKYRINEICYMVGDVYKRQLYRHQM